MQTSKEYDAFTGLLDQLCAAWDRPPAKDELSKGYWNALKDCPLAEVERNVQRILRTATGKQPFPKPAELRNEPPREATASADAAFTAAQERSVRNLELLRHQDPAAWRKEAALRRLDRIIATEWEGSPAYAVALREWRQIRGIHVGANE
jgi:hypothetical protein